MRLSLIHICFLGGAKLGLLLCRECCRRMGWGLRVERAPEKGPQGIREQMQAQQFCIIAVRNDPAGCPAAIVQRQLHPKLCLHHIGLCSDLLQQLAQVCLLYTSRCV